MTDPSPVSRPERSRARAARTRRRPVLDVDALVGRALEIIDAEGLDAVSMRRLAADFDTGPATLYSHVAGKDELLGLVLARILDEIQIPDGDDWREVVIGWCHAQRDAFQRHNDAARLCFGRVPNGDALLEGCERVLGAMIGAGVPPQVAAWAIDALTLYVTADVFEGWMMAQQFDDGSGRPLEDLAMEHFRGVHERFRALPPERYPFITTHADAMIEGDGDDRFAFGIETFVAGIACRIPEG